ncbi:MAG: SDR family oxidoreductase [Acidobacteria bacterium]|nr:SDR family oxidoreductase [Acidobacteriota bacterium]
MRRVLIAGCGYVGAELARRLVAAGDLVVALRRREPPGGEGIVPLAADLAHPALLAGLARLPRPDAVVYAASADVHEDTAYETAYVTGVRNLLAALRASGAAPRFVFVSSTGVYGQHGGEWVDEDSPAEPAGFAGRRLLEGEHLVADSGLDGIVLRLGGIYGPGRVPLIESVLRGAAVIPEGEPRYTNRIHRDDAARALEHLLRLPRPDPLYLGVDCEPAPLSEVLRWIARELRMPEPPSGPGGAAASWTRGSKRCSNRRLLASGFRFEYPSYREGFRALF